MADTAAGDGYYEEGESLAARGRRIPKPDQNALNSAIESVQAEIAEMQSKLDVISKTLTDRRESQKGVQAQRNEARAALNAIRAERDTIMSERSALFAQRDALKAARDARQAAGKQMREGLKFTRVEDIDNEIRRLHHRQATSTLSLADEKKVLKEIAELKASRRAVEKYTQHEESGRKSTDNSKDIRTQIAEKMGALHEVNERYQAQRRVLQEIDAANAGRQDVAAMCRERDQLRVSMNQKRGEIRTLRDDFRTNNDAYFTYMREVKKEKALRRAAEREAYNKEKAERQAELERELENTKPWQEEIALCDMLTQYLQAQRPAAAANAGGGEQKESAGAAGTITLPNGTVVRSMSKKGSDQGLMQLGGKKKRKVRKAPKQRPLRMSMDLLAHFRMLKLQAPTSSDGIDASLADLAEKRAYYDTLPRATKKKKAPAAAAAAVEMKAEGKADDSEAAAAGADAAAAAPDADTAAAATTSTTTTEGEVDVCDVVVVEAPAADEAN